MRQSFLLQNPTIANAFVEHLLNEHGVESHLFLKIVADWKFKYSAATTAAKRIQSTVIFRKYISPEGMYSINISWKIYQELEQKVLFLCFLAKVHSDHFFADRGSIDYGHS